MAQTHDRSFSGARAIAFLAGAVLTSQCVFSQEQTQTLGNALQTDLNPAWQRNPLGTGHALDGNLQVGSGGVNPGGIALRRELAYRNAIVTGNAPGGMSFRGDVGYTAANDFRGATGADTVFAFQRDSFYSSLGTRNLGGLGSVQSTLAFPLLGQANGLDGEVILNRPYASTDDPTQSIVAPRQDIFGTIEGTMRSPSGSTLRVLERPALLGTSSATETSQATMLGASDLLGIRKLPMDNAVHGGVDRDVERALYANLRGESTDDVLDTQRPNGATYERLLDQLGIPSTAQRSTELPSTAIDPAMPESGAIEPLVPPSDPLEPLRQALREAHQRSDPFLRELLERQEAERLEARERDPAVTDPAETDDTEQGEDAAEVSEDPFRSYEELIEEAIRAAREEFDTPVRVDDLTSGARSPRFQLHMQQGEDLLREGRWFDAEERFSSALLLAPGDPAAAVGRLHAQIGAGMYLSAGTNLRRLFTAYPEFMAARFDAGLLPTGERLVEVRTLLYQRLGAASIMNVEASALLAYLGVQTGNEEDVELGLMRLRELTTDPRTGQVDPLVSLLEIAWLDERSVPATPDDAGEGEGGGAR